MVCVVTPTLTGDEELKHATESLPLIYSSTAFLLESRKGRPSMTLMNLSVRKTGHSLLLNACAPEQLTQFGGLPWGPHHASPKWFIILIPNWPIRLRN